MYGACVRKNKDGNMPHDIAKIHGHYELADMLKHFAEFVRAGKYFSLYSSIFAQVTYELRNTFIFS